MLSPLRDTRVGASFVPALMAGKADQILEEWKRLTGDPSYVPTNLDDNWSVQLGKFLEPHILDWHQRKDGPLTRRGEWVPHPSRPWLGCTLDAYRATDETTIDAKWVGQWRKLDSDVIPWYTPQVVVQVGCTGAKNGALLICHAGAEPVEYPVTWTPDYEAEVWDRLDEFWDCVLSLTPPGGFPEVLAPVQAVRTYEMNTSNAWCSNAVTWLTTIQTKKDCEAAEKELKALVPPDAARCFGGGVEIKRDKAGRLSVRGSK